MSGSKARFSFWSAVLMASLVACGLGQRVLALRGVSEAESLVARGLACLALAAAMGAAKGLSLWPRFPRTQAFRALVAGLALTLFTLSYNGLTASAVAVLSNIDVALLVVLGPLVGVPASPRARALGVAAIGCLVWYVAGLEPQPGLVSGLATLAAGSVLLCFGYLFIKKSMSEESETVTTVVPSVAIILFGAAQWRGVSGAWTPGLAGAAALAGLGMFAAYQATFRLYELTDLATAEFPGLLSAVVIQPLEWALLGAPLKASYVLSSIAFVAIVFALIRLRHAEDETLEAEPGAAHA